MTREPNPMLDVRTWDDITEDDSVLVVDGHKITINVRDNCLHVIDGPDSDRVRNIPVVPATVKSVIITGSHGTITLEALRWMDRQGIRYSVVESVGAQPRTLATSGPTASTPKVRRKQAMCGASGPMFDTGLAITRRLLAQKIDGQAYNAEKLFGDFEAAKEIRLWGERLPLADDIETMHGFEGNAASRYWECWDGMPILWKGNRPLKPHWQKFDARTSKRHEFKTNRNASDPINAALNYGHHLVETQCTMACYASGLDPEFGISHADKCGRYSFALDLSEVLYPMIEAKIIERFRKPVVKAYFEEIVDGPRKGTTRLKAPFSHGIVSDVQSVAKYLRPAIKDVIMLLRG